jgi:hypothetical protein
MQKDSAVGPEVGELVGLGGAPDAGEAPDEALGIGVGHGVSSRAVGAGSVGGGARSYTIYFFFFKYVLLLSEGVRERMIY